MRKSLHWKTKAALLKLLSKVCHQDADGYSVYEPGFTDKRTAAECSEMLGVTVTVGHVSNMRFEEFGNVRRVPGGARRLKVTDFAELLGRVSAVEALAAAACSAIETLTIAVDTQQTMVNDLCALACGDKLDGRVLEIVRPVGPDTA